MRKKDLVLEIAGAAKVTRSRAEAVYNAIIGEVMEELGKGNTLRLRGFGTFTIVNRSSRKARNPRTGKECIVPERPSIRFRAGRNLINTLNNGKPG